MDLSNSLVYNGAMECGNQAVAEQVMVLEEENQLKEWAGAEEIHQAGENHAWLKKVLMPRTRVLFIDTDSIHGYEEGHKAAEPSSGKSENVNISRSCTLFSMLCR